MPPKPSRKTPTPRYMAAKLLEHFAESALFKNAAEISELFDSKVSEAKRDKVMAAVDKLSAGLRVRLKKIIDRFEVPYPRRPSEEKSDG